MRPGSWNDTTILVASMANLSDASALGFLRWSTSLDRRLRVAVQATYHHGDATSELHPKLTLPDGRTLPQTSSIVSVGLSLDL
jgi:hypothetical protein